MLRDVDETIETKPSIDTQEPVEGSNLEDDKALADTKEKKNALLEKGCWHIVIRPWVQVNKPTKPFRYQPFKHHLHAGEFSPAVSIGAIGINFMWGCEAIIMSISYIPCLYYFVSNIL